MANSGVQVKRSYEYEPPLSLWIAREQKLCTDLLLHVGEGEHYRVVDAHRAILVANSPYFEDALVINNEKKIYRPEMDIPDMTEKQVLCILKYIYTQIIEAVGMESLLDTLYGAHRFQIRHLVVKSQKLIEELLKSDFGTSIVLIDNLKRLYDEDKYLLDFAKSLLQPNLKSILRSEDTQNVSYDTMEVLLDLYQEEIPETAYFETLDRWAIATCRKKGVEPDAAAKRDVAGNLIEKIHFNELSMQYIGKTVQDSGLLKNDDMFQLLLRKSKDEDEKPKITRKEKHIFVAMDEQSADDTEEHVIISIEWFNKWKTYIDNSVSSNHPGPVNNETLFTSVESDLGKNVDFKISTESSYEYLIAKYGCTEEQSIIRIDLEGNIQKEPLPGPFEFQAQVGEDLRQGSPVIWEVPQTGQIEIEIAGARGGNYSSGRQGGRGAMMKSEFGVKKGDKLSLIVGHRGGDSTQPGGGAGGGGATIVSTVQEPPKLLLIGGGGGGASQKYNGENGVRGENGTVAAGNDTGRPELQGRGGQNGDPGSTDVVEGKYGFHGGVGAGWNGQGQDRANSRCGGPGCSRQRGWRGGDAGDKNPNAVGGFGGGGGGGQQYGCAGAGGGFSGGGAGVNAECNANRSGVRGYNSGGGSGGSFSAGSNTTGQDGGNQQDHGYVIIKYITAY